MNFIVVLSIVTLVFYLGVWVNTSFRLRRLRAMPDRLWRIKEYDYESVIFLSKAWVIVSLSTLAILAIVL